MDKKEIDAVSPLDAKMGIIQKWGWKGMIVVALSSVSPFALTLWENYNNKHTSRAVNAAIQPIIKQNSLAIVEMQKLKKQIYNMETIIINCKGGIKVLNADEINKIVRNASTLKAQRIRDDIVQLLYRYKYDSPTKLIKFKAKVKEIMQDSRKTYMSDVKGLQQRGIGTVHEYLTSNFPRKKYLEIIMLVISNNSVDTDKYQIAEDAYTYMLDIQDVFLTEMYKKMKESE